MINNTLNTNKVLLYLFAALILTSCHNKKHVKIMTWNIWHGGLHGQASDNFSTDTANTINIYKVLQETAPDILFMQETYCCGMDMAKKAGYKYAVRASSNLSIHSKYPITDSINIFHPFNSQAAVIEVEGQPLLCINLWLNYLPDYFRQFDTLTAEAMIKGEAATRLPEIQQIVASADSLAQLLKMPIIIGGDFNASSHLDWVESTKGAHFDKVIAWPVSTFMAKHAYKDSFREIHSDPSTSLQGTWGFLGNEGSVIADRIDYIYYKGKGIQAIDARIVSEDPSNGFFNSDHRAILSTFAIGL